MLIYNTKRFINGYSEAYVDFYHPVTNVRTERIQLPETDADGLIETWTETMLMDTLLSGEVLYESLYWHGNFDFSFRQMTEVEESMIINKVFTYQHDGYKIVLTPNKDLLQRYFRVCRVGDIQTGLLKGGINAQGNKLMNLTFITLEPQTSPNWINPSDIQYAGYYYDYQF